MICAFLCLTWIRQISDDYNIKEYHLYKILSHAKTNDLLLNNK